MYVAIVLVSGIIVCGFLFKRGKAQKMSEKAANARKTAQTLVDDTKYKLRTEQEYAAHRAHLRNRTQEMLDKYREDAAEQAQDD